jgi:hypothetical protein
LVALAEIGSSPIIIRMGKDTAEPDEAAVLRKPQANPAATPSTKDQTSYSSQAGIICLSLTPSILKQIRSLQSFGRPMHLAGFRAPSPRHTRDLRPFATHSLSIFVRSTRSWCSRHVRFVPHRSKVAHSLRNEVTW